MQQEYQCGVDERCSSVSDAQVSTTYTHSTLAYIRLVVRGALQHSSQTTMAREADWRFEHVSTDKYTWTYVSAL